MKLISAGIVLAVSLLPGAGARAAAEIEDKVAVVDMERVMAAHPETKEAEALLQKQADDFEAEKDEIRVKFERLQRAVTEAREAAENKALSDDGRAKKREAADDKLAELRDYDREVAQTVMLRQKQLADRKRRMRDRIVGKIKDIIRAYAVEKGYALVLDSAGVMDNPGAVLYHTAKLDITADIMRLVGAQKVNRDDLENMQDEPAGSGGRAGAGRPAARAGAGRAAATNPPAGKQP